MLRRQNKGITTILATTFAVTVIVLGLAVMTSSLLHQNNLGQVVTQRNVGEIEKLNEGIELKDAWIDNKKLNMTVINTGALPVKLVRMWVTNTTAANGWHQSYDLDKVISPADSWKGMGLDLPITPNNASSYKISVISERGSSASFMMFSAKDRAVQMSLFASPRSIPTGQDVTLMFGITNNLTDGTMLHSLTPKLTITKVEAPIGTITATATLVSGPTPTVEQSLAPAETVLFKWVYNIAGDVGDRIDFNATLTNAKLSNYVTESATVVIDSFAGQSNLSLQALTTGSSSTTKLKQIIKGSGVTGGTTTDVTFSPALTDITKAFHIISYRHNYEADHADTFKSSEIINTNTLRLYSDSSGGANAVDFQYTIFEFDSASPIIVQRSTMNFGSGSTFPRTASFTNVGDLTQTFLLNHGHTHNAAETTIGCEEYDRVMLTTTTTWELDLDCPPNSGPQDNRVEIVDWNDATFIKRVQRGTSSMSSGATSVTLSAPTNFIAIDRTHTLLFVSAESVGESAADEDPQHMGLFATIDASGNIIIERHASGVQLSIAWELVEFQPNAINVQHVTIDSITSGTKTATISAVTLANSTAFGTVSVPFGHGGSRSATTTDGAINRMQFTVKLDDSQTVRVTRGYTGSNSAKIGVQVLEFKGSSDLIVSSPVVKVNMTNTGTSTIWIDKNTRVIFNNTANGAVYAGLIQGWKNFTSPITSGTINSTLHSDAWESNTILELRFSWPRVIPGDTSSNAIVSGQQYHVYVRISGYDEAGKFVIKPIFVGTAQVT